MTTFKDKIRNLSKRLPMMEGHISSEEATKTSLVLPFISALGFDIFDPMEVVPEFVADVGTKKGEKVDYAVKKQEKLLFIVEVKKIGMDLEKEHRNQLFRYFTTTQTQVALLTNGIDFWFYSDLEQPNKMDDDPFLIFSLKDYQEKEIEHLEQLTKNKFDLKNLLATAKDSKDIRLIRVLLRQQFDEPDAEFCKFFYSKIYPSGRYTKLAQTKIQNLVQKALSQEFAQRVNSRIQEALLPEKEDIVPELPPSEIVTTEEELQAFRIVKSIVEEEPSFPIEIDYKDFKSYFNIFQKGDQKALLCRLYFNNPEKKKIGIFISGQESTFPLETPYDIFKYAECIHDGVHSQMPQG